jgi:hypothetical protein
MGDDIRVIRVWLESIALKHKLILELNLGIIGYLE